MDTFWFMTRSNKPRLRDPTRVRQIIGKYWFDFDCAVEVEQGSDGQHRLSIQGDGWPAAWLLPPDMLAEEFYPDFDTSGQEEFAAFLADIAPFLMEPLTVQAIGTADGEFPVSACEWRVEPNSASVARFEFTSDAEASLAMTSV
jgi:hypothetical protein